MYLVSVFISLSLVLLAMIHIYWGAGGLWPGKNKQDLIDTVFGEGGTFPSSLLCYLVAGGLFVMSLGPLISIGVIESPIKDYWIKGAFALFSLIFGIRGTFGYLPMFEKKWTRKFIYYNRRLYNPICISLAAAFLYLVLGLS